MFRSLFLQIALITSCLASAAQENYQIVVIDINTSKGIPNVSIKLREKSYKTDLDGRFQFESSNAAEKLEITHVAYRMSTVLISQLRKVDTIKLAERTTVLNNVTVAKRKTKTITLNKFSKTFPYPISPVKSLAQKFVCPKGGGVLQSITIGRRVVQNGGNPQTKFLLKVYDVNLNTGGPGEPLLGSGLQIVNGTDSKIHIDLSKMHISIPHETFFVGIDWMFIPYNEYPMLDNDQLATIVDKEENPVSWDKYFEYASTPLARIKARKSSQVQSESIEDIEGEKFLLTDDSGNLKYNLVCDIYYFFSPILMAFYGDTPGYIWKVADTIEQPSKWVQDGWVKNGRLGISATLKF